MLVESVFLFYIIRLVDHVFGFKSSNHNDPISLKHNLLNRSGIALSPPPSPLSLGSESRTFRDFGLSECPTPPSMDPLRHQPLVGQERTRTSRRQTSQQSLRQISMIESTVSDKQMAIVLMTIMEPKPRLVLLGRGKAGDSSPAIGAGYLP